MRKKWRKGIKMMRNLCKLVLFQEAIPKYKQKAQHYLLLLRCDPHPEEFALAW